MFSAVNQEGTKQCVWNRKLTCDTDIKRGAEFKSWAWVLPSVWRDGTARRRRRFLSRVTIRLLHVHFSQIWSQMGFSPVPTPWWLHCTATHWHLLNHIRAPLQRNSICKVSRAAWQWLPESYCVKATRWVVWKDGWRMECSQRMDKSCCICI